MDKSPTPWRIGQPTAAGTLNAHIIYDANGHSVMSAFGVPQNWTLEEIKAKGFERDLKALANMEAAVNAVNAAAEMGAKT